MTYKTEMIALKNMFKLKNGCADNNSALLLSTIIRENCYLPSYRIKNAYTYLTICK